MRNVRTTIVIHVENYLAIQDTYQHTLKLFMGTQEIINVNTVLGISKKEHEQVCPNNKQKVYHICKTCGKTFMQTRTLATHIHEVHEGRRNHKCESCGKAFSNSGRRKRHIDTVHKGLKPHQCCFCNTAYGQSGDLKRHIKRCHPNECKSLEEKK